MTFAKCVSVQVSRSFSSFATVVTAAPESVCVSDCLRFFGRSCPPHDGVRASGRRFVIYQGPFVIYFFHYFRVCGWMLVHGVQRYLGFTGRFVGYISVVGGWTYVCSILGEVRGTGYGDGDGQVVHFLGVVVAPLHIVWIGVVGFFHSVGLRG